MKYFSITILLGALIFLPVFSVHASGEEMLVEHTPTIVAKEQQFYVDVAIDTHDASINGIQGSVTFSNENLSFIRAETGTSMVTLWVDPPLLNGDMITFSGVIPGGFDGLVDPFDPTHKQPGEIVRLVFEGKSSGTATITTQNVSITDNDGKGTLENLPPVTQTLTVSNNVAPSIYTTADTVPPMLTASVVIDKNLFDGKYTLIFNATDKESGVDHIELKEGDGPWTTIQSPYLLHEQEKRGILILRAYDVAGNVTTLTIAPPPGPLAQTQILIVLVLIILIILYVIYKKISNRKKKISTS